MMLMGGALDADARSARTEGTPTKMVLAPGPSGQLEGTTNPVKHSAEPNLAIYGNPGQAASISKHPDSTERNQPADLCQLHTGSSMPAKAIRSIASPHVHTTALVLSVAATRAPYCLQ